MEGSSQLQASLTQTYKNLFFVTNASILAVTALRSSLSQD
jgi:hypothetical protein